jgi:hypothetical protein
MQQEGSHGTVQPHDVACVYHSTFAFIRAHGNMACLQLSAGSNSAAMFDSLNGANIQLIEITSSKEPLRTTVTEDLINGYVTCDFQRPVGEPSVEALKLLYVKARTSPAKVANSPLSKAFRSDGANTMAK